MSVFTLFVTQAPLAGCSHQLALEFADTLLSAGHELKRVFFYQDATYIGLNSQQSPQGQASLLLAWQQLQQQHHVPLQLCIANALRRGIVDAREQQRYALPSLTLATGFELAGLGELAEAHQEGHHVIQF